MNGGATIGPHLIAVDIGNSFMHAAEFAEDGGEPLANELGIHPRRSFSIVEDSNLESLDQSIRNWYVASVNRPKLQRLRDWLAAHRPDATLRVLRAEDFPLRVLLDSPDRVGVDRLAAATAVNQLRNRRRSAIIVDAGTATTIDWLDADGCFRGGVILAGNGIAARALAEHTDALPLVTPSKLPPNILGTDTESAIASGLFWGSLGAIRQCIAQLGNLAGDNPELFFTGGGSDYIAHLPTARQEEDLTLAGVAIAGRRILREAKT